MDGGEGGGEKIDRDWELTCGVEFFQGEVV